MVIGTIDKYVINISILHVLLFPFSTQSSGISWDMLLLSDVMTLSVYDSWSIKSKQLTICPNCCVRFVRCVQTLKWFIYLEMMKWTQHVLYNWQKFISNENCSFAELGFTCHCIRLILSVTSVIEFYLWTLRYFTKRIQTCSYMFEGNLTIILIQNINWFLLFEQRWSLSLHTIYFHFYKYWWV